MRVLVTHVAKPWGNCSPVLSDIKCQIVDRITQSFKPSSVLGVIKRSLGHGESLIGNGVLQLGDLGFSLKIVALHLGILGL